MPEGCHLRNPRYEDNFGAGQAGARVTGGGADSHPMQALALVADLLAQNKLVIKVQTFPFDRATDALVRGIPARASGVAALPVSDRVTA
jgi:hypothetical protein